MAETNYSTGLFYKKTLDENGNVVEAAPFLPKTLGDLVIMNDGTTATEAIETVADNMVQPDGVTILKGDDGLTMSVPTSTEEDIADILGDIPQEGTMEYYYTKSETDEKIVNSIPVMTMAEYEANKDDIPEGTKFVISDDYEDNELTEVKQARTNSKTSTPYGSLKERLDTEYDTLDKKIESYPIKGLDSGTTAGNIATWGVDGHTLADNGVKVIMSDIASEANANNIPTAGSVTAAINAAKVSASNYLGTITSLSGLSATATKGDFYRVSTAWEGVHIGDVIIAEKTETKTATLDGVNWTLIHNDMNVDTTYTFATGTTNGTIKVTPLNGTAQEVPVKGLGNAAYTGIDTSIPATPTDTNVLTTKAVKTELDKMAHKTSVSSDVNSTKSVINVTETNAQMTMVKSVSGKTIRANIFSGYTSMGSYTNASEKYNGHDCITSTGAWGGAYDGNMVLKSGKTYMISAMIKTSVANTVYSIGEGEAGTLLGSMTIASANTWTRMTVKVNATRDITKVRIGSQTAVTSTISEFMVSEYDQLIPYCPPSSLASAPVESVVSLGKNRIIKSYYNTILAADGRLSEDTNYNCFAVECVSGQKYNITADATVYAFYETLPVLGTTYSYNHSRVTSGSLTGVTAPITGYLVFRTASSYKYPACTLGNVSAITAADYIEPHKTTVLVPQSIRNLPDYGVENNIVDFENGTYTHNNTISNGAVTAYTGTDKVIPISDYLRPLPVENGGTITLVNEHNLDVSSTIKYKKEVN